MKMKKKGNLVAKGTYAGLRGAYAAMFTPIDRKGRVDTETIGRIVEYGLANGLRGFYLTGSTGGWFLLSPEERVTVWKATAKAVNGRCPLIAHVGATRTEESVALAKAAADVGMDWVSSIAPPVFGGGFEGVYRHYKAVSEATDLPFMVYSIGAEIVPERDIRFFDLKNVKGMKYTGRDYYAAQAMKLDLDRRKETVWFAGCDEQLLCALALKDVFAGGIGTTYNIIPRHFSEICRLADANDFHSAAKFQEEANKVVRLMIESPNWSYRKAMMKFIGIDCGPYRAPYAALTSAEERAFFRQFAALGIVARNQAIRARGTRR